MSSLLFAFYLSSQWIEVERIVSLVFVFDCLLSVFKLSVDQRVLLSFLRFTSGEETYPISWANSHNGNRFGPLGKKKNLHIS